MIDLLVRIQLRHGISTIERQSIGMAIPELIESQGGEDGRIFYDPTSGGLFHIYAYQIHEELSSDVVEQLKQYGKVMDLPLQVFTEVVE